MDCVSLVIHNPTPWVGYTGYYVIPSTTGLLAQTTVNLRQQLMYHVALNMNSTRGKYVGAILLSHYHHVVRHTIMHILIITSCMHGVWYKTTSQSPEVLNLTQLNSYTTLNVGCSTVGLDLDWPLTLLLVKYCGFVSIFYQEPTDWSV